MKNKVLRAIMIVVMAVLYCWANAMGMVNGALTMDIKPDDLKKNIYFFRVVHVTLGIMGSIELASLETSRSVKKQWHCEKGTAVMLRMTVCMNVMFVQSPKTNVVALIYPVLRIHSIRRPVVVTLLEERQKVPQISPPCWK
uniref:Uncharacterized protein n=1 Tax=Glossina pallidipes TaxID=7398 RepID=A0A1A9Z1S0_GLOPL